MGKQFAVLHIEKSSGNAARLGSHIDRKHQPLNADKDKAHLNQHGKQFYRGGKNLNEDIEIRLKEAGVKVRKNSVKSINMVLTGSHERMKEIEKDPKLLGQWLRSNFEFIQEKYGRENIMRFSLHRDERTPHIHTVITPITKDGRLSAREIVGNKKDLQQLQDDYGQIMNKYELSRGVRGSKATHDSIQEYYARINSPLETVVSLPEKKKALQSTKSFMKEVRKSIEPLYFNLQKLQKENLKLMDEIHDTKHELEIQKNIIKTKSQDRHINRNRGIDDMSVL